jgi:NAD(P)-dependent dehydrogenase (short-subunit alcohol dehydrogenase family)
MAHVFITGSADGLRRLAVQTLLHDGHDVVLHARNRDRLAAVRDLLDGGATAVVGDLSDLEQTRDIARQVNRLGQMDAVIHNAGVYTGPHVMPVNILAPYLLTALIGRPQRLIYLSSSEHYSGRSSLTGIDWSGTTKRYPDSKLFVTTLAAAVARIWAEVLSNAVDPGWVPTKMGGPGAPDDLRLGHLTRSGLPPATIQRRAPPAATGITSAASSRIPASMTGAFRTNYSMTWRTSPPRVLPDRRRRIRTMSPARADYELDVRASRLRCNEFVAQRVVGHFDDGPAFTRPMAGSQRQPSEEEKTWS